MIIGCLTSISRELSRKVNIYYYHSVSRSVVAVFVW